MKLQDKKWEVAQKAFIYKDSNKIPPKSALDINYFVDSSQQTKLTTTKKKPTTTTTTKRFANDFDRRRVFLEMGKQR